MVRTLSDLIARCRRILGKRAGRDAEDLAQDVALRILHRQSGAIRNLTAFQSQVARNLVVDGFRRVRASGGVPVPIEELGDSAAPWVRPDQESALLLKQIILGLPPIYRDTFILNRFMGFTYAEIAQRQGITVKAVEYRMSRALALCAEALRD